MGFRSGDLGLGSAVGWVIALIIFTISLIQIRVGAADGGRAMNGFHVAILALVLIASGSARAQPRSRAGGSRAGR